MTDWRFCFDRFAAPHLFDPPMALVGISLGSNLGDRLAHLRNARERLRELAITPITRISPIFETEPVDCAPGDPSFLNAVIELETDLLPQQLLERTQKIEVELGRPSEHGHNEPRHIDLDLLYFDQLELDTPKLVLPHPRMNERGFVIVPLATIHPERVASEIPASVKDGVSLWRDEW